MTPIRFRFPVFLFLAVAVNTGYAHIGYAQQQAPEGLAWLQKIARSARELNYAGTFVYQHGNQVETSRITHFVDAAGEHEKLEALDGSPREIIRNNDQVMCYFPDAKTVKVDKRSASRTFPALLPEQLTGLANNYQIRIGSQNRIAGHDCQVVILEPKDKLRYGHRFCAAIDSGLLLKAKMLNERNDVVEQFAFTQLTIGDAIGKEMVESRFDAKTLGWKFDRTAAPETSA
ncbi:MAG: transcriptional regulator, partial [Burkholderiales bacterium]|nr:transcriptional regulator [Burkholderiales bacterium]